MSVSTETAEVKLSQAAKDLIAATAVVQPLAKSGKDEGVMITALMPLAGGKAKKALRLMTLALEASGFATSPKERAEEGFKILAKLPAPKTWTDVVALRTKLADELDDTEQGQALGIIKKFAKKHEIELPKKPKSEPGEGGARGFRGVAFTHIVENAGESREEFVKWIEAQDKKATDVQRLSTILDLCVAYHNALTPAEVTAE